MPAFVIWALTALLGGLRFVAGSVVASALVGLGVGVVTYQGMDITFAFLKAQALANFSALPSQVLGMLSTMKVGECISIITSAMTARLAMTTVRNAAGALVLKRFLKL